MLMKGSLTPGTFQAFFQYMNMSSELITELSYMTNSLQSALASMERVCKSQRLFHIRQRMTGSGTHNEIQSRNQSTHHQHHRADIPEIHT